MMRWPAFSRRTRTGLLLFALLVTVALFPLRLALDLTEAAGAGVSARQAYGSIWRGRIDGLTLGAVSLGDVNAAISPVQLLAGRLRLDLWRDEQGQNGGALSGAWTSGFNQRGIDDVTGAVPVGGAFAPLPLGELEFDDVTIYFAGRNCAKAQGKVRVRMSGRYAGLNLSQGLSGPVTCDGMMVLFPLVSQTGMERLNLRVGRDGRFAAQIAIRGDAGSDRAALTAAGLMQNGSDYVLSFEGRM